MATQHGHGRCDVLLVERPDPGEHRAAVPPRLTRCPQHGVLAFTRIFLEDPGLVILDEASSRLDPATENLIEHAVSRLLEDRTGFIIAHRLATVTRADDILILEDGDVVEFGDRTSLVADPSSRFSQLLATGMEEVLA